MSSPSADVTVKDNQLTTTDEMTGSKISILNRLIGNCQANYMEEMPGSCNLKYALAV